MCLQPRKSRWPRFPFSVPFPAAGRSLAQCLAELRVWPQTGPPALLGGAGHNHTLTTWRGFRGFFPFVALAVEFLFPLGSPGACTSSSTPGSSHAKASVPAGGDHFWPPGWPDLCPPAAPRALPTL